MNLIEVLVEQVRAGPQAAAIIESRRGADITVTFSELDARSAQVANLLRHAGVRAGDPVLIFLPISSELYGVLLALFRLGAVAMFVDVSADRNQIAHSCELLPPRALIASPKAHLLRLISPALRQIPLKFVLGPPLPGAVSLRKADAQAPLTTWESCGSSAPALLTFTSGSTGLPKATVRTHGLLLAQRLALQRHLKLVPGERDLTTLPIVLLANLASGVTSVVPDADLRKPGAIRSKPVLAQMARHGITRSTASPAFFERLLSADPSDCAVLGSLRKVYTGGAPVFPRLLERLSRAAPRADIQAVYGSTEAEPIALLGAGEIRIENRAAMRQGNGLLAGTPVPEIRLHIIRDQWGHPLGCLTPEEFVAMQLPQDQVGEIVVSGDHVLKGYLHGRGDEETKLSVAGQIWHRTGDAGKLDPAGRLWLLGRCEAKVQDTRGTVYPFAVECVASEHPHVQRAAFLAHGGQRWLVIQPDPLHEDSTRQELSNDLQWAALDRILALGHNPVDRRHNAKIDYPALRRLLSRPRGVG